MYPLGVGPRGIHDFCLEVVMVARSVRLALALFALGPVAAAQATTPGHWDPVTSANGVNIDQIATVRTPDGRVHVIWHRHTSPSTDSLVQTVLTANGSVGAPQEIAS